MSPTHPQTPRLPRHWSLQTLSYIPALVLSFKIYKAAIKFQAAVNRIVADIHKTIHAEQI